MQTTLMAILKRFAVCEKIGKAEEWAANALAHATFKYREGNKFDFINDPCYTVGVKDGRIEFTDFCLCTTYINNSIPNEPRRITELYNFSKLTDDGFKKRLHDAFYFNPEAYVRFALFFETYPVEITLPNEHEPLQLGKSVIKPSETYLENLNIFEVSYREKPDILHLYFTAEWELFKTLDVILDDVKVVKTSSGTEITKRNDGVNVRKKGVDHTAILTITKDKKNSPTGWHIDLQPLEK